MNTSSAPSLLARAQRLGAGTLLALAPLAAPVAASTLTVDYATSATYSSSGFFTGAPSTNFTTANGTPIDGGFKLWGEDTRTDDIFWNYSTYYGEYTSYGSTSGVAFVWGGKILGGTTSDDKLNAPFTYSINFTGTESSYVSTQLIIGYSYNSYTPQQYSSTPNGSNTARTSFGTLYGAGNHELSGNLSVNLTDSSPDGQLYWFALLTVDWQSEFVAAHGHSSQVPPWNNDSLTVTIPQHSIDVTYYDAPLIDPNPPGHGVPDTGSTFAMLGMALVGLVSFRRRK